MLTINIKIEDVAFENAIAKSVTLSQGDDLSDVMTNIYLADLKQRANSAAEAISQEQLKVAIEAATEQKKADFDVLIEAIKK